MNNKGGIGQVILILIILGFMYITFIDKDALDKLDNREQPKTVLLTKDEIMICSWNIKDFGPSKASKPEVMGRIANVLEQCDIAVIQEVSDITGEAWKTLCTSMDTHICSLSERKGTTSQKEQYGLLYRRSSLLGLSEDESELFDRPPTSFKMISNNWTFTLITLHSKPDNTPEELDALDNLAEDIEGNVIVLGDFNQDSPYYRGEPDIFTNWTWIIPDGCDSNVADTIKCYDRMYINNPEHWPGNYGINTNIDSEMSDHYLVYGIFDTTHF